MIIVIKTLRFYSPSVFLSLFFTKIRFIFASKRSTIWSGRKFELDGRHFNENFFESIAIFRNAFIFWGKEGWVINSTMESQDAGGGWYELQDRRLLRFISGQRINRPPLCTNLRNNWYAMGSRAQTRMGFNTAVALNVQHRTESLLL